MLRVPRLHAWSLNMNSLRKLFYRPRKDDRSLLAQFYYADEELNFVAAELDSFDGRKDPERCTSLVNQLRQCQDKVLNICMEIMDEVIPEERATRDFRVKFPDDVMQENLAGQLWFGAECLAAGSSIMNREVESSRMRPLAKAVTKTIETVRNLLREQCLKPVPEYTEKIRESMKIFDRLFSEFELAYVSAMVPVKSVEEHDVQQNVVVLFSETLQRALQMGVMTQEQVDNYDPALMFTIPRLAIVAGLVVFSDGPLNLDRDSRSLSELFRPFRTLLSKIRELLWSMSPNELAALEKALCSMDEPDRSQRNLVSEEQMPLNEEEVPVNAYGSFAYTSEFVKRFYANYPSCKYLTPELSSLYQTGKRPERQERKRERTSGKSRSSRARQERQSERYLARLAGTDEERPRARRRSRRTHASKMHQTSLPPPPNDSESEQEESSRQRHHHHRHHHQQARHQQQSHHQHHRSRHHHAQAQQQPYQQPVNRIKVIACSCGTTVTEEDAEERSQVQNSSVVTRVQPVSDTIHEREEQSVEEEGFCVQQEMYHDSYTSYNVSEGENPCGMPSSILGNVLPNSTYGDQGPSYVSDCVSNVVAADPNVLFPECLYEEEARLMHQTQLNEYEDVHHGMLHLNVGSDTSLQEEGNQENSRFEVSKGEEPLQQEEDTVTGEKEDEGRELTRTCDNCHDCHHDREGLQEDEILVHEQEAESVQEHSLHEQQHLHSHCHQEDEHKQQQQAQENITEEQGTGVCSSGSTSPHHSGAEDDEEVALALQAAEVAATWRARSRFSDPEDLIHRLFVCISGVADQLQTNYASDLRKILKYVFLLNQTPLEESMPPEKPCATVGDDVFSNEGTQDSERLSVESAEDALVVIGSPQRRVSHDSPERNITLDLNDVHEGTTAQMQADDNFSPDTSSPTTTPASSSSTSSSSSSSGPTPASTSVAASEGMVEYSSGMYGSTHHLDSSPTSSASSSRRRPVVLEPPPWIPDDQAPRCMACGASFTVVRRRHHCRNCGKVFCAHCSQHTVPLPHYGIWKAVRVCNVCFLHYVTFTTDSPS